MVEPEMGRCRRPPERPHLPPSGNTALADDSALTEV
jgi:hypothetical protein